MLSVEVVSMRRCLPLALPFLLLFGVEQADAATIVPPRDLGELARGSDAVVVAHALSSASSRRGSLIFTLTDFVVERGVAGSLLPGDLFRVEVPGGEIDGVGLAIAGAPAFESGQSYLMFLHRKPTGEWQPRLLAYGVFERVRGRSGASLLQPIDEAFGVSLLPRRDGSSAEPLNYFDENRLIDHLHAVVKGGETWEAGRAIAGSTDLPFLAAAQAPPSGCAYMRSPPARWQVFDSGGSISIQADNTGDSSITGGGFSEVQSALGMWDGLTGTTLDTNYGGQVSYTLSCTGDTDIPASGILVFNDPCGDLPDPACPGILALGGIYFSGTHAGPDSQSWTTVVGWFVLINNGAGCTGSTNYSRMVAHELGHGLGFDHFSDSGALMYFQCEAGGCNPINSTDIACAQYSYPSQSPTPPSPPANVQASDGTYTDRVRVTWNTASGATSYEVFRNTSNDSASASSLWSGAATSHEDLTATPGTTYWYWVKASNTYGTSDFSSPDSGYAVVCEDPPTPSASAPATASSGLPYSVTWTATSPDNSYVVQEAENPSFTGASSYVTTGTSRSFSHTVGGDTTYYYRVQARDNCGGSLYTSGWSDAVQVVVQLTCSNPSTPGISAPSSALSGANYVVSWSSTSPDGTYDLQESVDPSFTTPTTLQVNGTSRVFSHTVASPTTYYYRVRARWVCGGSTYSSNYSSSVATLVSQGCTAPGAFGLTTPANGAVLATGTTAAAVGWQPAGGAGTYDVYAGTTSPPPLYAAGLTGTATTIAVGSGFTYFWRVVAHASCNASLTTSSETRSFTVAAAIPPPTASFSYSPTAPLEGQQVQFTDTSTGSPTSWSWAFGDGGSSTLRNPTHTYAEAGSYRVVLTATNAGGSSQASKTVVVAEVTKPETVAVVAHTAGLGSSAWRSDVAASNPSDAALALDVVYKASGGAEMPPYRLNLAPRASVWLPDVMSGLLGLGDGRGSMRIVPPPSGPRPAVFSRTYSAADTGNLGQGIPSVLPFAAGTYYVTGLFQDSDYRTNIGLTAGENGAQATFDLLTEAGTLVASAGPFTLNANDQQQWQLPTLFPVGVTPGTPMTVRITLTGSGIPYGSVVDQRSLDSVFLLAEAAASEWSIPISAHNPGQDGTFWRTDLFIHNPTASNVGVTAEYLPANTDNAGGGQVAIIAALQPGGCVRVADVLGVMFGVTNGKGALVVSGGGASIVLASRTYTTRVSGGTLGQGVPAIQLGSISTTTRVLSGIRVDTVNRTNIGLVSLSGSATVDLVLRDADGTVLGSRSGFWIPPRSVVQLSFADAFPGAAAPNPVGSLEVTPHAPVVVYLSIIDGTSQDPSFVAVP